MGYYDDFDPTQPDPEPDLEALLTSSQKIGGMDINPRASVMRVLFDPAQQTYVFAGEVPVVVVNRFRSLPDHDGKEYGWIRLELKATRGEEVERGHWATLTMFPWSSAWVGQAVFKGACKKSKHERQFEQPASWAEVNAQDHLMMLEELTYDPWETNGDFLTAGLSNPGHPQAQHVPRKSTIRKQRLVMGSVEDDPKAILAKLTETEHAKSLLKMTETRSIRFWPMGKGPVKLQDDIIADRFSLMHLALQQALAGPPYGPDDDHDSLRSDHYEGQPVTKLAEVIYKDHLYNANRRKRSTGISHDPADG